MTSNTVFLLMIVGTIRWISGFHVAAPPFRTTRLAAKPNTNVNPNKKNNDDGEVGTGPNWIERSFPVDMGADDGGSNELKKVEDYNLGISGVSFQTGSLSKSKLAFFGFG